MCYVNQRKTKRRTKQCLVWHRPQLMKPPPTHQGAKLSLDTIHFQWLLERSSLYAQHKRNQIKSKPMSICIAVDPLSREYASSTSKSGRLMCVCRWRWIWQGERTLSFNSITAFFELTQVYRRNSRIGYKVPNNGRRLHSSQSCFFPFETLILGKE